MQLNGKMMTSLVHRHGGLLIERIEAEAKDNGRLRWLLGGAYWWASKETVKSRLGAIADEATWRADQDARDAATPPIDFPSLSTPDLARVWVDQHNKLDKDRDDNFHALSDYERDLLENDPNAALDLVLGILKIETNESVLAVLAAGLLEDAISTDAIDRIECEAAADARFRDLLGGVWYWSEPDDLKARLDAILGRTPAPN